MMPHLPCPPHKNFQALDVFGDTVISQAAVYQIVVKSKVEGTVYMLTVKSVWRDALLFKVC